MVIYRTVLFYLALTVVIRLMGKRQVGEMEPTELVVTMLISNLATIPLEQLDYSAWTGIGPMLAVLVLERGMSWVSMRSIRLRRLLCGKPVILIDNGKLLVENLRKTRVTLDELSGHLREQGILAMETVQFAVLETNGSVSAFVYPQFAPACAGDAGVKASKQYLPYTVISDGRLIHENLALTGKTEIWLRDYLHKEGCQEEEVVLLTLTKAGKTCLIRREGATFDGGSY